MRTSILAQDGGPAQEVGVVEPVPDGMRSAVAKLTPRQRQCLRLVFERRTSKEIAGLTGLAVGTVDTYVAEAVAALSARNRRHAAELLHAGDTPRKIEPESAGVEVETVVAAPADQPGRRVGWADMLPLRRKGAIGNDLSPLVRFAWIVQLAAVLAIGFGMLAVGVDVLSRLLSAR